MCARLPRIKLKRTNPKGCFLAPKSSVRRQVEILINTRSYSLYYIEGGATSYSISATSWVLGTQILGNFRPKFDSHWDPASFLGVLVNLANNFGCDGGKDWCRTLVSWLNTIWKRHVRMSRDMTRYGMVGFTWRDATWRCVRVTHSHWTPWSCQLTSLNIKFLVTVFCQLRKLAGTLKHASRMGSPREARDGGWRPAWGLRGVGTCQASWTSHHSRCSWSRWRGPALTGRTLLPPFEASYFRVQVPFPDLLLQGHDHIDGVIHDAQFRHGLVWLQMCATDPP